MTTITQLEPVTATVTAGLSESFSTYILISGNTATPTFSETSAVDDLTVSPLGQINTNGTLGNGVYFISGTVVDADGNTGTWQFSLNVVGSVSPGTAVTPVQPALPSAIEMMVPFQIDPATGGVAVLTDYPSILAQHIKTIILTAKNERVMNPTYGFGLEQAVFSPITATLPALLQSDIAQAIKTFEPAVTVQAVYVTTSNQAPSILNVQVLYSVAPFNDVNTVSVSTGGTIVQVNPT